MLAEVRQIAVRYVRPEPQQEERLQRIVAELHARSILRAARVGDELDRQDETPADGAGAHPKERCA